MLGASKYIDLQRCISMADVLHIFSASMCMQFVMLYLIKTEF